MIQCYAHWVNRISKLLRMPQPLRSIVCSDRMEGKIVECFAVAFATSLTFQSKIGKFDQKI